MAEAEKGKCSIGKAMKQLERMPLKDYSMYQHLSEFRVGKEWRFYQDYDASRYSNYGESVTIKGKGDSPYHSSPLLLWLVATLMN